MRNPILTNGTVAPPAAARRGESGFTLAEVIVASAIFLFIAIAAFSVFTTSNKLYKQGDATAEMQQRTRLTFEVMLDEMRLAGFDYNRDGDENEYPDHPDEQIEYAGLHAIAFRANLDHDDADTGRETGLEVGPGDYNFGHVCCPIVTTANDEIVTYALRSETDAANNGTIILKVDTSAPRDAGWDDDGAVVEEETVTIEDIDLTGSNPPYTLMRFTVDENGEVQESPLATDVRNITFSYQGPDGKDHYCLSYESDGTCATSNRLAFATLGGADDVSTGDGRKRDARAQIRTFDVELVGLSEIDEVGWTDRNDTRMPGRRKLALTARVVPQNLGLKGRPDLDDREALPPTNVTLCPGQCNTVRVEWDEAELATGYVVKLFVTGQTEPFMTGATPGVRIPGSDPQRVFAVYQRTDAAQIVGGTTLFARVASRISGERTSEDSDASSAVTLADVTRLEEPKDPDASGYDPTVSGWPDVVTNSIPPVTAAGEPHCALENSIVVAWDAPTWALQVTSPDDPANTWTTRVGTGTHPPVACDVEETTGDDGYPLDRTRARDIMGTTRYLIFRSTNPRFVPTNADFVTATVGDGDIVEGRVAFVDETVHAYANGVFNATTNAVENCKTYWYRVRAVDDCWDGTNPAGLGNLHVSPFSPRLNPDPSAADSDDTSLLDPGDVGLAVPGFAVPKAAPKPPKELRFTRYDRSLVDGDNYDAVLGFDATKMDTFTVDGEPQYDDITLAQYRVYSGPVESFTLSDCRNLTNGVRLERAIDLWDLKAGRIAYDDENGNGNIGGSEDESILPAGWPTNWLPRTGLRIDLGTTTTPRWFRVVAVQCANESTRPTDDPEAFDWSDVSPATKYPCEFGGSAFSTIVANASGFPAGATCDAVLESDTIVATKARLVLKDRSNGDRVMTPYPGISVTNLGAGAFRAAFSATDIAQLTDNFGSGSYLVSCEMDDSAGCLGISDALNSTVSTGSCCLRNNTTPTIVKLAAARTENVVVENCSIQLLRIMKISLWIDNANGGPAERFANVQWNGTSIWSGNAVSTVIDRSASPLTLRSAESGRLNMDFTRAVAGDRVTIQYDYKIGGLPGSCTFTAVMP